MNKKVHLSHFTSFNITSYFVYTDLLVVCLIQDSLILDQL